ncbi:MAG TPA: SAM-dependent methyltransferase [Myxococcota bacterium]
MYLGSAGHGHTLMAELAHLGARHPSEVEPGLVVVDAGALVDPCFARQVLAGATRVSAPHGNDLAAALLDTVSARDLPDSAVVITPEMERRGSHALEEHPLAAAQANLASVLEAKIVGRRAKHGIAPSGLVLECVLVDAWAAWVSVRATSSAPALLSWPSPFSGGRALGEDARDAPSSAHRKLDEALAWLGAGPGPGDVVLDLGAAPGGWSWVCLQRGASVIAVDRADLSPDLLKHPLLTHVRADAFKYVPERAPTWLLCDVIAEPERSLDVAKRALEKKNLRGLVVTLKLKNPVSLAVLDAARALCKRTPGFFGRCKNLVANKLEVTLLLERAAAISAPTA